MSAKNKIALSLILTFALVAMAVSATCLIGCKGAGASRPKSEIPKETVKQASSAEPTKVKLETSLGNITIELDEKAAPITVKNFLMYVEDGYYDGTIFHRVMPDFLIQAGGFTVDMIHKRTKPPIVSEDGNGLKNDRGTVAMARTGEPNSANSQFFINVKNNGNLNKVFKDGSGYAVFGKVIDGMDVVDKIAAVKIAKQQPYMPATPVMINKAAVVKDARPEKK